MAFRDPRKRGYILEPDKMKATPADWILGIPLRA
jgi:hypothetical protein